MQAVLLYIIISLISLIVAIHLIYKSNMLGHYTEGRTFGYKRVLRTRPIRFFSLGVLVGIPLLILTLVVLLKEASE